MRSTFALRGNFWGQRVVATSVGLLVLQLLSQCVSIPSVERWAKPLVGQPVSKLYTFAATRTPPVPVVAREGNGSTTIVAYTPYEGCSIEFQVDSRDVIVGFEVKRDRGTKNCPSISDFGILP